MMMTPEVLALCTRVAAMSAHADAVGHQWAPNERVRELHALHTATMLLTYLVGLEPPPCCLCAPGLVS